MVAAALTVWILFSFWLTAPLLHVPHVLRKAGAWMLWAELVALLVHSYGAEDCMQDTCAPVAQAAGIAARTDLPILAAAFLTLTAAHIVRRTKADVAPHRER